MFLADVCCGMNIWFDSYFFSFMLHIFTVLCIFALAAMLLHIAVQIIK